MADSYDAVVVGAGPNGLVGALTLAQAGRRVLLVEAADRIGGAMRSEQLTLPGFVHDVGATVLPLALASPALRDWHLDDLLVQSEVAVAHPLDTGAAAVYRSLATTTAALGADAKAWDAVIGSAARAGTRLGDALLSPLSPRLALRAAGPLARYGASGVLPATTLSRHRFRTEPARALLAGMAAHSVLSLSQLSTAGYGIFMAALAHQVGWPVVRGGTEQLAIALADRLRDLGGEIETGRPIHCVYELPDAPIVLLDVTPRQLLSLAGEALPPRYTKRLRRFRYGPAVFKIDYALDAPAPWRSPESALAPTVHVGGTLEEIAASERDVAAGRHSDSPFVIAVQPTVVDPSRAPAGKHTFWAYCHVPNGSSEDMTNRIEAQLERYAPGFRDRVLARHVMAPKDLEAFDPNLVGGDIGGGAADLRQFVARPVLSARPWATPLRGVYLCSASTPPGGGVHGMGGYHAARLALRRADG